MQSPEGADAGPKATSDAARADRLSVALCTYNGARFLDAQLESYLEQTRRPDELVVCDDGSTDDTLALLNRFASRAPFPVRIFQNEARLGPTKNFDKAIRLCTGDVIATSDQDDIWLPDKLALSLAGFDASPRPGLVFTNAEIVEEDLRSRGHAMWDVVQFGPRARQQMRRGLAFQVLLRQWVVTGATMVFRAELRPYLLPIPAAWVHDAWIALIVSAVAPVAMVERSTVKYRQHPNQQIGGKKLGWRELYEKARTTGPAYFHLMHERFVLARERVQALAPHLLAPAYLDLVDAKVAHQERRLAISQSRSRLKRAAWACDELVRGGYQRFAPSTGAHFLKDLLF
jgi:glycosyltransferase involved in cell wall biosynthesis